MKILITGSNGQVGQQLTSQLQGKAEVLAVDIADLDITDAEAVKNTVNSFKPDVIINAAAHTAVDRAETEVDLSYKINSDGPKHLAEAAESINAAILHISTDYVFSGDKTGTYSESDETGPQSIYGHSKLAGEKAVADACTRHIILRTAWVFGEHGNNFVKTMLRLGKERDALSIVGDQFGCPTYAGDIAAALIAIAEKINTSNVLNWGVYHFGGLPSVSWFEFATHIFSVAEKEQLLVKAPTLSSITTEQYPTPAKRPANSKLDTAKISKEFNVKASDWKKALENLSPYCQ